MTDRWGEELAPVTEYFPKPQERISWEQVDLDWLAGTMDDLACRENALHWIRYIAGMHFLGGAFEPDHMRALANIAIDGLAGKDMIDFHEAVQNANVKADELIKNVLEEP